MMIYACLSGFDVAKCGKYYFLVIGCLNVDQIKRCDVECRDIELEQYFELLSAESEDHIEEKSFRVGNVYQRSTSRCLDEFLNWTGIEEMRCSSE
jgi:hypothetical protein